MDNTTIARYLLEHAATLEQNGHNLYRVRAYRRAASVVRMFPRELSELLQEHGREGLEAVPGLGSHLAYTIEGLIRTGEFRTLGPGVEPVDPHDALTSLPGVGPRLAQRMREELGITTVEQVEDAAREGRLQRVGIGPKRLRGMLEVLASRRSGQRCPKARPSEPSVADLFEVDEEYRSLAECRGVRLASWNGRPADAGEVPVLQTRRGDWTLRATFSNTPLAHRLGLTRDWVVIRFDNGETVGERTVVTETRNHLNGQRVIRGRERECQACWAS
jgi:DNA polymerase (family 10)